MDRWRRQSARARALSLALLCPAFCPSFAAAQPAAQPELLLQYGHAREVIGTPSFSPDGRLAATQDGNREIVVWDLGTGRQLRRLRPVIEVPHHRTGVPQNGDQTLIGNTNRMRSVFSSDGRLLAASGFGNATVWEVESGRRVAVIMEKPGLLGFQTVPDLAFGADGRSLYMPDGFGGVDVYDAAKGTRLHTSTDGLNFVKYGTILGLAASADGAVVIGAGRHDVRGDRSMELHWARVMDGTGKPLRMVEHLAKRLPRGDWSKLQASSYAVGVAVTRDGRHFALGGEGSVWLHETATGNELRRLDFGEDLAAGVAFSPDGKLLAASGSVDYSVRLWDVATGQPLRTLANPRTRDLGPKVIGGYSKVAFSPDGRRILATTSRGALRQWDVASGEAVSFIGGGTDAIRSIAASADGKKLAVLELEENVVRVWDLENGQRSASVDVELNAGGGTVVALGFSADGREGISVSNAGDLRIWDAATGEQRRRFDLGGPAIAPADASKCGASVSGRTSTYGFHGMKLSADGRYLAAGARDCTLRVWETGTGKEIRRIEGLFELLALSADGRWLAATLQVEGHAPRVWEVATGKEMTAPPRHDRITWIMFFNPDGTLVFSLPEKGKSGNGPLVAWDVENGREIRRYPPRTNSEAVPRYSSDGRRAVLRGVLTTSPMSVVDLESGATTTPAHPATRPRGLPSFTLLPGRCCVALGGESGEIHLVDLAADQLVATLLSVRHDGDWLRHRATGGKAWQTSWLVVTPDGLFDGPPESIDKILWRFSDQLSDVAPGEAFFNEFYRPGLLAEILAGQRPKAPRDIARLDRRQPQVRLSASAAQPGAAGRTVTVTLAVTEAPPAAERHTGSGARDVRLFRNGALVKAWRGDVLAGAQGAAALEARVTLVAGENRFSAYAFNNDNVKSADATLLVAGDAALRRPGTAWVLAVGVNRYANPAFDLRYAVADAESFVAELAQSQKALGLYERVQAITLRDGEATKANFLLALRRLAGQDGGTLPKGAPAALAQLARAQPEDAVFVFFAGHGLADDPRFYLVPHDLGHAGAAQLDAGAMKAIFANAISDLELEQVLEPLDAGRLVMVIDACHSGQALEAQEKRRGPMNSRGLAQLAYEKGMYVLTAAQGHQAALEFASVGHGLLTHALVEAGLKRRAADRAPRDGRVMIREWLDYASAAVPSAQLELMKEAEKRGRSLAVIDAEKSISDVLKRTLQQPRVFYRREPERQPFVVSEGGAQ